MNRNPPHISTAERLIQPEGFSLPAMESGHTNRKAKRWAGKQRRRERLRDIETGKAYAAIGERVLLATMTTPIADIELLPYQQAWLDEAQGSGASEKRQQGGE